VDRRSRDRSNPNGRVWHCACRSYGCREPAALPDVLPNHDRTWRAVAPLPCACRSDPERLAACSAGRLLPGRRPVCVAPPSGRPCNRSAAPDERPQRRTTSAQNDLNAERPQRRTTSTQNDLNAERRYAEQLLRRTAKVIAVFSHDISVHASSCTHVSCRWRLLTPSRPRLELLRFSGSAVLRPRRSAAVQFCVTSVVELRNAEIGEQRRDSLAMRIQSQ
jgi:hypothetical protein